MTRKVCGSTDATDADAFVVRATEAKATEDERPKVLDLMAKLHKDRLGPFQNERPFFGPSEAQGWRRSSLFRLTRPLS